MNFRKGCVVVKVLSVIGARDSDAVDASHCGFAQENMPHSDPESLPSTELNPAVGKPPATDLPALSSSGGGGILGAGLIPVGAVLGDRYRVVRLLAQGGFGRTYLAEDLQRFNESCVLKEFAPQVHGADNLAKAQSLFEREAGVLYRLDHDQIPRFRELRQTTYNDQPYLLLIQDFVPGWTYRDCLGDRQQHGKTLSEAEVALMLKQLLPVLAYLHSRGVIHRDIAPDNLIQRDRDGLPVLIDFGAVKQAAVTVINEISNRSDQGTRLGKLGYAPPEQMQQGAVFPHSDIYALGATALTLLSGEEPHQLMDPDTLDWTWGQAIHLSPGFAAVINRMVALRPRDRYPSARAALRDLERLETLPNRPVPSKRGTMDPSLAPAPTVFPGSTVAAPKSSLMRARLGKAARRELRGRDAGATPSVITSPQPGLARLGQAFWPGGLLLGGIGFLGGVLLWQRSPIPVAVNPPIPVVEAPSETAIAKPPVLSEAEVKRRAQLDQRRSELGIPAGFFAQFIGERFDSLHPEIGGRELTPAPSDNALRQEQMEVSDFWLEQLSVLGTEQRSRLGSYGDSEFEQWVATAATRSVNRNDFLDRVDKAVAVQLPEILSQGDSAGVLQVRRAIASTVISSLRATSSSVATIAVDPAGNAYQQASLKPGQTRVQQVQLRQGQNLRIILEAPAGVKLALYKPGQTSNPLVSSHYWEGRVPVTGKYQIRLSSDASSPLAYTLNLIVE